mgnify:CR=1 FL=1|tara:strand:- start:221 stop:445 length:225 start_codon:yes stop_codon:yes gene_type:complete
MNYKKIKSKLKEIDKKLEKRRLLRIVIGIASIIVGIIGGFIPILQGWIFILFGSYLLFGEETVNKHINKIRNRK